LGDTQAALRALSEALTLAEEIQNNALLAEALVKTAEALLFSGERDGLLDTVKRGLDLAEATGQQSVRAYGLGVMAAVLFAHDRPADAVKSAASGLALARELTRSGDRIFTLSKLLAEHAQTLCRCAQVEQAADQRAALLMQAMTLAREAVAIAEESQSASLRLRAYSRLGEVQLLQGDADLAAVSFGQAEAMRGQFNDAAACQLAVWQLIAVWQHSVPDLAQVQSCLERVNQVTAQRRQPYLIQAEGELIWQAYQMLRDATDLPALVAARQVSEKPELLPADNLPSTASAPAAPRITLMQHDFRVFGFGNGRVWRGDELLTTAQWGWSIPRELFYYILTMQQATRTQIANAFWRDASTSRMQSSFHSAKFAIRQALGISAMKYVNGQYTINAELDYLYDVSSFEQLVASAERSSHEEALPKLIEAADLYQDDFLIDSVFDWADSIRNSLQVKFQRCCRLAGMAALAVKQPDVAVPLLERAFGRNSLDEDAARMLMLLQWQCGRRRAALEAYATLQESLQREFGIYPDSETETLAQTIRAT
jgi:DNA-binding SARP family transcriptional activator